MIAVQHVEVLPHYTLNLHFNDGVVKTISFLPFIQKGFARQLLDSDYFAQVKIESGGGLEWPNGYDFCPNFLHELSMAPDSI
jgi:hypothetical protein